jgi:hypothetical protein
MKKNLAIAVLMLAAALCLSPFAVAQDVGAQAPTASNAGVSSDQFVDRERASWEAWKQKNVSVFNDELAGGYVARTATNGVKDKGDAVNAVQKVELDNYDLSNFNVSFPDQNTAVVTYRADFSGRVNGANFHQVRDIRSTWTKQGDQWLVSAYQGTPAQ